MMPRTQCWSAILLVLAFASTACSDSAETEPARGVTLTVMVDEEPAPGAPGPVTIADARLVLGGIKLETAGVDGTVDWVFNQSAVIELDLSGDPVTAHALLDVPPGTYKEVEISIDKLEPGLPAEDALLAEHPDLADASIVITGTVLEDGAGVPFSFTAALDRDMEIRLQPFLVLDDAGEPVGVQVTLVLDLSGWFRGSSGEWLDPRDPAHRSVIEGNIQGSLAAFEDADRDGVPGPVVR